VGAYQGRRGKWEQGGGGQKQGRTSGDGEATAALNLKSEVK